VLTAYRYQSLLANDAKMSLVCMHSSQKTTAESTAQSLYTFSIDVTPETSGVLIELEPILVGSHLPIELFDSELKPPVRIPKSPDNLFANMFGARNEEQRNAGEVHSDFIDKTLVRLVSEGFEPFGDLDNPSFTVRRGTGGTTAKGMPVRWISFQDPCTKSWLLPDLSAAHSALTSSSSELCTPVRGVERFSSAEALMLVTGEDGQGAVRILVPPACREEAIDHFIRAVADSNEPSFLYTALEYEMVRMLDGETDICSENFHEVLTWIRSKVSWSRVGFQGSFCHASRAEGIILDLMMTDSSSTYFLDAFGSPYLRCKVSFGDPRSEFVKPLSVEWLPTPGWIQSD
jgi:hypothetical protein